MTVHPQTGKKEYIFVDLAAVYPTPEEQGTELSFEEIIAANRGWLDCSWDEDIVEESLVPLSDIHMDEIDKISNSMAGKLEVHRDAMLFDENGYDENGSRKEPLPEARPAKKKKMMETNETQISQYNTSCRRTYL